MTDYNDWSDESWAMDDGRSEVEAQLVLYMHYDDDSQNELLSPEEREYAKKRRRELRGQLANFLRIPYRSVEEAAVERKKRGLL